MKQMTKTMTMLMILTGIAACDYSQKREFRHERKDRQYQTAMAEYQAGRLDRAADEFGRLLKTDPANASARFQLACLQQDFKRDYLAAYCNYREFLCQQPDSERSKLARDRLAICEREMAKALAEKHGIASGKAHADDIAKIRAELQASEKKRAELEKSLSGSATKIAALEDERKRLVRAMRTGTDTEKDLEAPSLKDAKALLDEEDEDTDRIASSKDAKALKLEADGELDRATLSRDAKALKSEGEAELADAMEGPKTLPVQPAGAKAARDAAKKAAAAAAAASRGDRPREYTVEDGDTLIRIAERFYGRKSAWTEIRNANKTIISVDGRVRAGDRIVLP